MIFSLFSLHNKIPFFYHVRFGKWHEGSIFSFQIVDLKNKHEKGLTIWITKIQANMESRVVLITSNERKRPNNIMLIN